VLPFENLGAAQDEYFADGLADAVRGKLALLAGVEVIARESSAPYRKTRKPPEQVARELGARYLLTGTVRWEKAPGGAGRVVVSPELVEVTPGNSPRARWQQPFAAALTDVFQVQGQIAGQVAQALDVALASSERRALEARPTADPTAYDYYLRGNVYFDRGNAEPDLRAAEELYSKAVALDSAFALAHARLALTHDLLYWFTYDRSPERLSKEKASADRAIRLRPDLAEAHLALGYYHYHGHLDYERALAEFEAARRLQPSNADVHFAIGLVRRRQGRWPEAVRHLRQSVELNPRSVTNLVDLANTHLSMRAYAEAESIFVRAVEIAPDNGLANALKAALPLLWRGDTLEAERRVREALVRAGPERGLRSLFQPKFMVSSGIQSILYDTALVRESRAAFGSDTALYFRWWAGFHAYHGRREAAQAYFDSTRAVLQRQADRQPEEPRFHARLALVNENLGRLAEARSEAQRAVDLGPVSQDALGGAGYRELLARMLVRTGEAEAAVDQLAYLLSVPSSTSVAFLRIDPAFAPLRSNPRFQRLLGGA
jgi:TolB-like protein/Flp pilus assembly protein TadD